MSIQLTARAESIRLRTPLTITGHTFDKSQIVYVELRNGRHMGRGEASGVYYRHETPATMLAQIESIAPQIKRGASREDLLQLLPAGGARNAVDCAMWELESHRTGRQVAELAGLSGTRVVETMYTVSAESPERMAEIARDYGPARVLKLKLTGAPIDSERILAVSRARPDVGLAVDANQGFTPRTLQALLPTLLRARVQLIEQPFAIGQEKDLEDLRLPIPIAADESVQDIGDLAGLVGRVQVINIKLDKCGGLTRGLQMAREAKRLGFDVMVGCMMGTSLATAPGFVLGQLCRYIDLDSALNCANDRTASVTYDAGWLNCEDGVWGAARERSIA